MLEPDLENWIRYLFIAALTFVLLYTLWPYILTGVVLYAIIRGFTDTQHQHGNHSRTCLRRCGR